VEQGFKFYNLTMSGANPMTKELSKPYCLIDYRCMSWTAILCNID